MIRFDVVSLLGGDLRRSWRPPSEPTRAGGELAPSERRSSTWAGRRSPPGRPGQPTAWCQSTFHQDGTMVYGRDGNPTWEALEQAIGALEGGQALVFASGMAAIAAVWSAFPFPGRVVVAGDAYNGHPAIPDRRRRAGPAAVPHRRCGRYRGHAWPRAPRWPAAPGRPSGAAGRFRIVRGPLARVPDQPPSGRRRPRGC